MTPPDEAFLSRRRYYCRRPRTAARKGAAPGQQEDWPAIIKQQAALEPERMIAFFEEIIACSDIPDSRAIPIFEGLVGHLWQRVETSPSPDHPLPFPAPCQTTFSDETLARFILDALDAHPFLREKGQIAADAIRACGFFPKNLQDISVFMSHLLRIAGHPDPEPAEANTSDIDAISRNSVRGKAAEGTMRFAAALGRNQTDPPALLPHLLLRFATDLHPGVRISILKNLSDLSRHDPETAWRLFQAAMRPYETLLWPHGEPFLQLGYGAYPQRTRKWLSRNSGRIPRMDGKPWGTAFTDAFLNRRISEQELLGDLNLVDAETAWDTVWERLLKRLATFPERRRALGGLLCLMDRMAYTPGRLESLNSFFESMGADCIDITTPIAYKFIFSYHGGKNTPDLSWFYRWISALSVAAPAAAKGLWENLLSRIEGSNPGPPAWRADRLVRVCEQNLKSIPENMDSGWIDRILELGKRNGYT